MNAAFHSYAIEGEQPDENAFFRYADAVISLYERGREKDFYFTPFLIQTTHRVWFGDGAFRQHHTRPGVHPNKIEDELDKLCEWINWRIDLMRDGTRVVTWTDVAQFHWNFEEIHPFRDGNGRTGRGLLVALTAVMGETPPIIKAEWREQYISAMQFGDIPTLAALIRRGSNESEFPKVVPF